MLVNSSRDRRSHFTACINEVRDAPYSLIDGVNWRVSMKWNAESRFDTLEVFRNQSNAILYIGGNTGQDLAVLSTALPSFNFAVYEPVKQFFRELKTKFSKESIEGRITLINEGLGLKTGEMCQYIDGGSSVEVSTTDIRYLKAECSTKRNATDALQLILQGRRISVHMNCEGCEFEVLESWIQNRKIDSLGVIQFGSHRVDWINESVYRYCTIQTELSRTHTKVYGEPWAWERWVPKY